MLYILFCDYFSNGTVENSPDCLTKASSLAKQGEEKSKSG